MKQDKKKLFVIGALVMVLCAVGAFTLMGGGGGAPAKATATKKAGKAAAGDKGQVVATKGPDPMGAIIGAYGDYGAMESRDPFAAPAGMKREVSPPQPTAPAAQHHESSRPPFIGGSLPPLPIGSSVPGKAQVVPSFRVVGVLVGQRSIVVVEDSSGNQRLVPEGGQLDPSTRVTRIDKGQITVSEHGKEKTLPIQEGT